MQIEYIVLVVYTIITLCMLAAIQIEARKQSIEFTWIQALVAILWFIWIPFYLLSRLANLVRR